MLTTSTDDVALARAQVAALVLPPAPRVPAGLQVTELLSAELVDALRCHTQAVGEALLPTATPDLVQLRSASQRMLAMLPALPIEPEQLQARRPADDPVPHDAYFLLVRHEEESGLAYLRGLYTALDIFLGEAADPDDLADYVGIARSLTDLCLAALGAPPQPALLTLAATPAAKEMRHRAVRPVERWLRGHQLFGAITQGLVWTLHTLARASEQGDATALQGALARMASLYQASADAFRFTADFDPWHYTNVIRPSMCEPQVPPGFSGTLSVDHAHMVRLLSGMAPALQDARARWPEQHEAMRAALSRVYQDHKWVCERFDGAAQPSLRTDSHQGDIAATEMLERFHQRRRSMLS